MTVQFWSIDQDGGATGFGRGPVPPQGATIFDEAASWQTAVDAYTAGPPELRDLARIKADARQKVTARVDALTAPILSRYPAAERAGWDKREAEAKAIVAADDSSGDVAAAIAATLIVAAVATAANWTEAQTIDHARSILTKAAEFAAISADAESLRETGMAAIEAAGDAAGVKAALDALDADAAACAVTHGLG